MSRVAVFCAAVMLCTIGNASAITLKECSGKIVHESPKRHLVDNFVEDVLFLLPASMSKALLNNQEKLMRSARFELPRNYWSHSVISETKFKQKYYDISQHYFKTKSNKDLAVMLGDSIVDVFEVAMRANDYDPMNEKLRNNMEKLLGDGMGEAYDINFDGYQHHSFDILVARLYQLKKFEKLPLYSELVNITAKLWTAVWIATGNGSEAMAQSFVRRPCQIGFIKADVSVTDSNGKITKVRDLKEAAIVLNSKNEYEMERDIVKKRIGDHIDARVKQEQVEMEHLRYKRAKGLQDDKILIATDDLASALEIQHEFLVKSNQISLSSNKKTAGESTLDSLELTVQKFSR